MNNKGIKEYIKMCEKAEEIQEIWKPEEGDMVVYMGNYANLIDKPTPQIGILAWADKDKSSIVIDFRSFNPTVTEYIILERIDKKDCIWLPTQSQLQRILLGEFDNPIKVSQDFVRFQEQTMWLDLVSLEQYWLACVIYKKFGKIWDGKKWVKRRDSMNNNYTTRDKIIHFSIKLPEIECKKCRMTFVVLATISDGHDYIEQELVYYCPYCGTKFRDKGS